VEIIHLKQSELKPYEHNNLKHPANQIEKLCKQIEAHGFDVPIVVDANNVIIKGHARHAAAKKLKLKTVPVIVRADLTPEQCAAARLADNKLSELAEIDMVAIQAELDSLKAINFDLDLTAFDSWNPIEQIPFEPDLPDDEESEKKDGPLVLRVEFDNDDERQLLFFELRDRGLKVKV
jgi:ParB/RepB/Spo0J family partition protein